MMMLEKIDFIARNSELARTFGIRFVSVLHRGSQYRVEAMMLRMCKPLDFIHISLSREQVRIRVVHTHSCCGDPSVSYCISPLAHCACVFY